MRICWIVLAAFVCLNSGIKWYSDASAKAGGWWFSGCLKNGIFFHKWPLKNTLVSDWQRVGYLLWLYVITLCRGTPDASTNHDLYYIYSDDNGRSRQNNGETTVAVSGSRPLNPNSSNIRVWRINQNRGLINQEHMAIDYNGRVHVLLSHMPDSQRDDANFTNTRKKASIFIIGVILTGVGNGRWWIFRFSTT